MGPSDYFQRVSDAVEHAQDQDRIQIMTQLYNEEIALCKPLELFSLGLVHLSKVTVMDSCTLRGIQIDHVDVIDGKSVLIVDCLIETLTISNSKNSLVCEGSKLTNLHLKNSQAACFTRCQIQHC